MSVIQPMDQGVIEVTRNLYRESLLDPVLLTFKNSQTYEIDLLCAMQLH